MYALLKDNEEILLIALISVNESITCVFGYKHKLGDWGLMMDLGILTINLGNK